MRKLIISELLFVEPNAGNRTVKPSDATKKCRVGREEEDMKVEQADSALVTTKRRC